MTLYSQVHSDLEWLYLLSMVKYVYLKTVQEQLHKKCKYEYDECNSLTSRHKVILDRLT